jgi:hypothetical protein
LRTGPPGLEVRGSAFGLKAAKKSKALILDRKAKNIKAHSFGE